MDKAEAVSTRPRGEAMKEKQKKANAEPFVTISGLRIVRLPITINSPSQPPSVNSTGIREKDEPAVPYEETGSE